MMLGAELFSRSSPVSKLMHIKHKINQLDQLSNMALLMPPPSHAGHGCKSEAAGVGAWPGQSPEGEPKLLLPGVRMKLSS